MHVIDLILNYSSVFIFNPGSMDLGDVYRTYHLVYHFVCLNLPLQAYIQLPSIFECNGHISQSSQQQVHRTKSPPYSFTFLTIRYTQMNVAKRKHLLQYFCFITILRGMRELSVFSCGTSAGFPVIVCPFICLCSYKDWWSDIRPVVAAKTDWYWLWP